ncbi:hypothetical protein BDN67DRAFT_571097 [Paxillus ammoniavirescens]|nr:hypothetical protein BDN67DRAFT_571097 [Paxillus ammoniavirescens]
MIGAHREYIVHMVAMFAVNATIQVILPVAQQLQPSFTFRLCRESCDYIPGVNGETTRSTAAASMDVDGWYEMGQHELAQQVLPASFFILVTLALLTS